MTVTPKGEGVYALDPFPFAGDRLETACSGRYLAAYEEGGAPDDLAAALAGLPTETQTYTLVRGVIARQGCMAVAVPAKIRTMTAAFDTLTAARRMEEAGMKREQAEAVAEAVRSASEADLEHLATKSDVAAVKSDVAAVKAELKADIAALGAELKADIAALKAEFEGNLESGLAGLRAELVDRMQSTERRMYAAVFGVGGLLFAALKLVP